MIIIAITGQSNAEGTAPPPLWQSVSNNIFVWRNSAWQTALEPLQTTYAGPGLAFAQHLLSMVPYVQIGLVPCAVSGSTAAQWQRGQTHYEYAKAKINAALATQPPGTTVGAFLHSQGEADTFSIASAEAWPDLARQYSRAIREDTGRLEVPFMFTQLGADPCDPARPGWIPLRDVYQLKMNEPAASYPWIRMIETKDLPNTAQHFKGLTEYQAVGARAAATYWLNWGQS